MATITVRALDSNGDPLQGNGQTNFLADLEAMTQILRTRLLLFVGEWFLDLSDGLPMFSGMLGSSGNSRNIQIITNIIVARLRNTRYVVDVINVFAAFQNRKYLFGAEVVTQFGSVFVSNANAKSPAALTT